MKVEKFDGGPERRVLTGMIVNRDVLARVADRWDDKGEGLFAGRWANLLGGWCVAYYRKYDKAPGANIQPVYEDWAEGRDKDDEESRLVGRFLGSLDGEYATLGTGLNPDHVTDEAAKLFNATLLRRVRDQVDADLDAGDVDKAMTRWEAHRKVELGAGAWIDPAEDAAAIDSVFDGTTNDSVVEYRDGLGAFFGRSLGRDCLVAIMASEKKGKSWWLLDIAFRGFQQGLKVAMFECGDLTERQVMGRYQTRINRRPLLAGKVTIPTELEVDGHEVTVTTEDVEYPDDLTAKEAREVSRKAAAKYGGSFRLSVHPNSSISVPGIRSILTRWGRDGWTPDLVVVDYADILANPYPGPDGRDQINMTWKLLRRMSQELHALVVTATQADADSYETDLLRRKNFSEDKRKYAHVSGIFGLNQTDREKEEGRYRLNWLARREEEYSERRVVHVAGCLAIANPAMYSVYPQMRESESRV